MDRTLPCVTFAHPALLGDNKQVVVRQNLAAQSATEEGTARWVWPGALATANWLCERGVEWILGKHVVELGAGTGLLGLVASRLGAKSVTLTDLPSELPLLQLNVEKNYGPPKKQNDGTTVASPCSVKPLRWGDVSAIETLLVENTNSNEQNAFDVMLCCDLLYHNDDDAQRALAATMQALVTGCEKNQGVCLGDTATTQTRCPGNKQTRVLFAYQFRENVLGDCVFFETITELFGDAIRHETSDEDLWLMEYRVE